jgi:hypothetical protein
MRIRRRYWLLGALGIIVITGSGAAVAYADRVGPQFPLVEGTPYAIEIAEDGCPVDVPEDVPFVDSPGQFVAPDPSEVILCSRVDTDGDGVPEPPGTAGGFAVPPLQRTLHGPAAVTFAALLNQLPDRNGAWRDWQRRHSGFWPDAPWANGAWDSHGICFSTLMLPVRSFAFVLRYPDRAAVPIIDTCHGWTDGTRSRIEITYTPPHLTDQFIARYES